MDNLKSKLMQDLWYRRQLDKDLQRMAIRNPIHCLVVEPALRVIGRMTRVIVNRQL